MIQLSPRQQQILSNIGWLVSERVFRLGLGLIVTILLVRYLGPTLFGTYSFLVAVMTLVGALATLGLQGIVVRDLVQNPERRNETLGSALVLMALGAVVGWGAIIFIVLVLRPGDELASAAAAILGLKLLFDAADVFRYWFEAQVQSRYVVWVQNGALIVVSAIKLWLIYSEAPLLLFFWMLAAESALVAVGVSLMFVRHAKFSRLRARLATMTQLLADAWPLIISSLAIVAYMRIDIIMLGEMLGDAEAGLYSSASRISEAWYFIAVAINASLRPDLLALFTQSPDEFHRRLRQVLSLMIWLALPIAAVLSAVSEPLVVLLFGREFASAAGVLAIHVWAGIFVFINAAMWHWYYAEDELHIANIRLLSGLAVNILLNLLLIPLWGIVGAAVATLISRVLVAWGFQLLHPRTRHLFLEVAYALDPRQALALREWRRHA